MSIKDVPMMTVDEVEINLNSLVYLGDWSSGYNFNKEGEVKIDAWRVISVDNSHRHFRIRSAKGCEREFHFSKGCSRENLFGTLKACKDRIRKQIADDLAKCNLKLQKIKDTQSHIRASMDELNDLENIKSPKAVKV